MHWYFSSQRHFFPFLINSQRHFIFNMMPLDIVFIMKLSLFSIYIEAIINNKLRLIKVIIAQPGIVWTEQKNQHDYKV